MRNALVVLSILLLSSVARADGGDDPAALLRQARTAETVDRDVPRAIALYRRALSSAGNPDASRDAALALGRIHEERGDRQDALNTYVAATERFAARMDDETKRRVHDAI